MQRRLYIYIQRSKDFSSPNQNKSIIIMIIINDKATEWLNAETSTTWEYACNNSDYIYYYKGKLYRR